MNDLKCYQWDTEDLEQWKLKGVLRNGVIVDIVTIDNPVTDDCLLTFWQPLTRNNLETIMNMIDFCLRRVKRDSY